MASSYTLTTPLFISIAIFFILIPTSLSQSEKYSKQKEKSLKSICSKTSQPKKCWQIISFEYPRFDKDNKGVAEAAIDLALTKAESIHDRITRIQKETKDSNKLKKKYNLCTKSYNSAIKGLKKAKKNLGSKKVSKEIKNALGKVKKCKINGFKGSSYKADIVRFMNKDFTFYAELVKAAIDRFAEKKK